MNEGKLTEKFTGLCGKFSVYHLKLSKIQGTLPRSLAKKSIEERVPSVNKTE
jgi:hypothetical protein